MLKLILGTAGTGKTTLLMDAVRNWVADGRRAILLVPEQYSFEAERLIYRRLGPRDALKVEVLSFTRLAQSVFRKFGGLAGVAVTEAGRCVLMSVVLGELRDGLTVYRSSAAGTSFLEVLVRLCSELKAAGITPERLEEILLNCEEQMLREKLDEILLIYRAWQALMERSYYDPDDDMIRAGGLLSRHSGFFENTGVFVDGFTTFMAAEFDLLGHAVAQAEQITVALTADSLDDSRDGGVGVFSPVRRAARRLIRMAEQAEVSVASPVILTKTLRYCDPVLEHLSRHVLQPAQPTWYQETGDSLQLRAAGDRYREFGAVASEIATLVRDYGYCYKEIAVVVRDTQQWLRAAESAFGLYDIPYFVDAPEQAENMVLTGGVLAALEAVQSGFDAEAVLLYAKSPLLGLDLQAVAELENYCYSWGVRGSQWSTEFRNNPRGLAGALTEEDLDLLGQINRVRSGIVEPLMQLNDSLKNCTGRQFAEAVYEFLQCIGAGEHLMACSREMEQSERSSFLDVSAQLWDLLMEILDVFGAMPDHVTHSVGRICELFRLAVNSTEVSQVPQTLDQVLFGQADRIRPGPVRAVFVMGANEGEFPLQGEGGGIFTEQERQELIRLGAELSPPALQRAVLERFYCYFALTLPSERLYVSWSEGDLSGRQRPESVIVGSLRELFPQLEVRLQPDRPPLPGSRGEAAQILAGVITEPSVYEASLRAWFEQSGSDLPDRMKRFAQPVGHRLDDMETARALFGGRMRLSPRRIEQYYRCPFSYFVLDGLGLRRRTRVEFSPLESGSVIHHVLQEMVRRHGGKGLAVLTWQELEDQVRDVIQDYLQERIEDMQALPVRFHHLFGRLVVTVTRLLQHLGREFAQSAFEPVAVELEIRADAQTKPLELETPDGRFVTVEGVVDRVDVMNRNGRRYLRVVDYKSGGKQFRLHDVFYGLNLQMLLYLFTLQENGVDEMADAIPAGILYLPAVGKYVSTSRDADPEDIKARHSKQWKMNGLLLDNPEALRGMEQDLAGIYIPVKLNRDGKPDAGSALVSLEELGRIGSRVRGLITGMSGSLTAGKVPALPSLGGDIDACAFCDYRVVCGHEDGDAVREIAALDREAFFRMLQEEDYG